MIVLTFFCTIRSIITKKLAKLKTFHRVQLSSNSVRNQDLVVQILTLGQNRQGPFHSDFYSNYENYRVIKITSKK